MLNRVGVVAVATIAVAMCGCQWYTNSTPRRYLESDDAANFERVFRVPPPVRVDVVRSVVIAYQWRPGVVTTDDWEFELVASQAWVNEQVKAMHLIALDPAAAGENTALATNIRERQNHPIRPWYAPGSLSSYDAYYSGMTSIPYVHVLVDKRQQPDGRHVVYASKH